MDREAEDFNFLGYGHRDFRKKAKDMLQKKSISPSNYGMEMNFSDRPGTTPNPGQRNLLSLDAVQRTSIKALNIVKESLSSE